MYGFTLTCPWVIGEAACTTLPAMSCVLGVILLVTVVTLLVNDGMLAVAVLT